MTGEEFRSIRKRMGMRKVEFADALGYEGTEHTNWRAINMIEKGERNVSADIERRVRDLVADFMRPRGNDARA